MPIDRKELQAAISKSTQAALENKAGSNGVAGAAIGAGLKYLADRFDELEKRIEEQPFAYDGPHESGKTYRKGMFVTHAGSLWHANYTTASRPGDGPAWTLAVKRGSDGKDLRQ